MSYIKPDHIIHSNILTLSLQSHCQTRDRGAIFGLRAPNADLRRGGERAGGTTKVGEQLNI